MQLEIYAGLTTTLRPYNDELRRADIGSYTTTLNGLYGTLEIFLATDPTRSYQWFGGDRVVVRDGLDIAWEGVIETVNYAQRGDGKGLAISCVGGQSLLGHVQIDKRWADNRLSAEVWKEQTDAALAEIARVDRKNRLRFAPINSAEITAGQDAIVRYTMPTGRTIKRITFNWELSRLSSASPREVRNNALTLLANTADGDPATSNTISLAVGEYLYIGSSVEFDGVTFDLGATVNGNTATISGDYVQAESHTWQPLAGISDGTLATGKTLAQDGTITFTRPTDWASDGLVESRAFWIRLTPSANLTANVVINEITVGATQDWGLRLVDEVGPTDLWSTVTSGSGSEDVTLGTPRQALDFRLTAQSKFVTAGTGSAFGQVTDVMVYDETDSIHAGEIAKDLRALVTTLNSDETQIGDPGYSLAPFLTNGPESAASILDRAVSFGDSDGDAWGWSVVSSKTAATPDGRPVLRVAELPSLADYDYAVTLKEARLLPPFELVLDYGRIVNSVHVAYTDSTDGKVIITPADQATLQDAASVAAYGLRARLVSLDNTSAAAALSFGEAFLAANKEPRFMVSGPISIVGNIRSKDGGTIPASRIEAGKRLRIEDYLEDIAGASGLTFIITATNYSPVTQICTISTGDYDDLSVLVARMAR